MLDIFSDDAFGVVPLTDAINKLKFVPSRINQLGIFSESSVSTTSVAIEQRDGVLSLIAPTPRGGPGHTLTKVKRTLLNVAVPHFEIPDSIMAEEVQGVRAWGSETMVETVMGKVAERQAIHSQSMEATQEYARIGAIKGIVTYADGTTFNLFTQFGVSQIAEVDFDLDNANPASGALRKKCAEVIRLMAVELGGTSITGASALCGDAFYDDLIAHPEVRETYLGWTAAQELRTGYVYGGFPFGGIMWENYRGAVDGTAFIHTDKCHIFPVGVPGLFRTYYAPADYNETVNTMGQRLYSKQYEMPNGKGYHLDTQMNALDIATRPRVLIQGKRT
jgi:hypothetical protein